MTTILLIEDDLNQRLLYQMELEDEEYSVVLASNGWEALQQAKKEHPDLVVLDLGMPGMDGIEVLGRMMGLNAKLPVIIYSANESFKDNFMTWVADSYVVKSSNLDVLKEEIERVLLERKGEGYRIWPEGEGVNIAGRLKDELVARGAIKRTEDKVGGMNYGGFWLPCQIAEDRLMPGGLGRGRAYVENGSNRCRDSAVEPPAVWRKAFPWGVRGAGRPDRQPEPGGISGVSEP